MSKSFWDRFADEICPPGVQRDAIADTFKEFYVFLQHESVICTMGGLCVDGSYAPTFGKPLDQLMRDAIWNGAAGAKHEPEQDDDLGEPEGDSEAGCSELELLVEIRAELRQLREEVKAMANNETLDQAVTDLGAAVTNKLASDSQLDAAEANLASDTAKVQQLTSELNAETAAEQAALNPAPAPAPAPAPVPDPTPVPTPVTTTDPTAPNGITTNTPTS